MPDTPEAEPKPLPPRHPKPPLVHYVVDTIISGLVLLLPVWFFLKWPWWSILSIAAIVGLLLTPYTLRLETRQLLERAQRQETEKPEE